MRSRSRWPLGKNRTRCCIDYAALLKTLCLALWLQDSLQVQNKAGQLRITGNRLRMVQHLDGPGRPVNEHLPPWGVNQPAQARAVIDVFLELPLEVGETVRGGPELDHKVWAEGKELFPFLNRKGLEP